MGKKKKVLMIGVLTGIAVIVGVAGAVIAYTYNRNTEVNCTANEDDTKSKENTRSNREDREVKPVIYLYANSKDKDRLDGQYTNVKLHLTNSKLTTTYPKYDEDKGWNVIAKEDGTIYSDNYSETYNYLYWEAEVKEEIPYDFRSGFCVEGNKSIEFLEKTLKELGLNRREANEFIVYWLPILEGNKYSLITFQTNIYNEAHKLEITPSPDNILRVYMTVQSLDEYKEIKPQDLVNLKGGFKREGFTVVEWGGTVIND